jgi:hypothetical protein
LNLPDLKIGISWEVLSTAAHGQTFASHPGKAGGLPVCWLSGNE